MSSKLHNPGGKVCLPMLPGVHGDAEFSACGKHRFWLSRVWRGAGALFSPPRAPTGSIVDLEAELSGMRAIGWIAMNPSQADVDVDDPTVRREIGFSRAWGYDGLVKFNVLSYRATKPADLPNGLVLARPARNLDVIVRLAPRFDRIVLACGNLPEPHRSAFQETLDVLAPLGVPLFHFGKTQFGFPKHPLYLAETTPLLSWP